MQFSIDTALTIVAIIIFALYVYLQARSAAAGDAANTVADRRLIVEEVVHAAEQMFKSQSGQERLNYVMTVLEERLPDLNLRERRQMIEATVFRMNHAGTIVSLDTEVTAPPDGSARWN